MPTPSSNAPDSQTPRSYPFSTCPDPDDQSQPESESQEQRPSQEPSSWHPHPPPPYSAYGESQQHSRMDEDVEISRSTTMSPRPQSSSTEDHDMDPEGMMAVEGDSEDSHKQADNDETIMNTDAAPVGGIAGAVAAESSSDIAGRRRPADHVRSRRKADQEPVSPVVTSVEELDGWELSGGAPRWIEDSGLVGMGYEYAQRRVIATSPSSYLRPGSRFSGTQQSERQRYDVQVEIKYVDMRESFLCGYLRIQGLTDDHPTLTTYFEGEIIGPKYGFVTQHPSWGSTEKIDFSHWNKFTAFRHIPKQDKKRGQIKDVAQRENIFMRWKEHFLVPDHKVKTINGASFEGFYYICFNQIKGEVSGIYFHSKSEKFQQLELKHVQDKGCFGAMEFR